MSVVAPSGVKSRAQINSGYENSGDIRNYLADRNLVAPLAWRLQHVCEVSKRQRHIERAGQCFSAINLQRFACLFIQRHQHRLALGLAKTQ